MSETGEPEASPGGDQGKQSERIGRLTKRIEIDDRLMNVISHDLNSAIGSTAGLLTLLLDSNAENLTRRQRNILKTLLRSAAGQHELIENITIVSRILRGRLELYQTDLDLRILLQEAYGKFKDMAVDKKVELVIRQNPSALINADQGLTLMALGKIITNAIWFTPPGGKVELSTQNSVSGAALIVTDTGVGIEQERLDILFDLSLRQYTLGARDEKGAGLGLYVAREIVRLFKGDLKIESKSGKGTCVQMIYPVSGHEPAG